MRAVISLFLSSATALVVNTIAPRPGLAAARARPLAMMAPIEPVTTLSSVSTVIADDTLLLASGGLLSFLFVGLVVGTIIVNFGIMKK